MTAGVYFNEIDAVACAVLRETQRGFVDERSIKEVTPDNVRGYERCHFFAGAGLWELAANIAGWRGPIWTASCPCQPFSVAGKGAGRDDPRHLWPDFFRLARACRPPVIVGEQVAGAAGFDWFDGVAADLEGEGYACRAVDVPACAVDAPHRRQRLYWVAVRGLADPEQSRERGRLLLGLGKGAGKDEQRTSDKPRRTNDCGGLGDAYRPRLAVGPLETVERRTLWHEGAATGAADNRSFWMGAEWLECADGKARRAQPGVRMLVNGMAGRADLWRLAGNSIVPQLAAQVLAALAESLNE